MSDWIFRFVRWRIFRLFARIDWWEGLINAERRAELRRERAAKARAAAVNGVPSGR